MSQITPAVLVAALVLAGCAGSQPDPEPAGPATSAASTETTQAPTTEEPTQAEPTEEAEPTEGASDDESPAPEAVITISYFAFDVPEAIAPGSEVTVVNKDAVAHTVTSDEEGLFDVVVEADSQVTFTVPDEPGDYSFFCTPHPTMVATLVVG